MCFPQLLRIDTKWWLFVLCQAAKSAKQEEQYQEAILHFLQHGSIHDNAEKAMGNLRNACRSSASRRLCVCVSCAVSVSVGYCTNLALAVLHVSGAKSQLQDARPTRDPTVDGNVPCSNRVEQGDNVQLHAAWLWFIDELSARSQTAKTVKLWWTGSSRSCISSRPYWPFPWD